MHICSIPISDHLIGTLLRLHVRFFINHQTGETFIARKWWEETNDQYRLGITAMVAPALLAEMIKHIKAKRAEGQVTSE